MDTNNIDKNIWSEFENLHLKVSGRKTRSQKTWDLQLEQIVNGEAILVYGRDPKNFILIGAALFVHTKHESLYAVAAYVRDELPMPISHAIQYVAMEYMKNNGVYWHKIGEALLNERLSEFSPKEKTISNFKAGFASNLISNFQFRQEKASARTKDSE
jgi:FemAB family protein